MPDPDPGRFERLILPHLDDAYALACYLLRDEHDAQDAVQDAVLRALRHFEGYREGDPRAWLLAITRNCCLSWLSRRRDGGQVALPEADMAHAPELHHSAPADEPAIRSSDRAAIERALAALPIEFREVVVLREINGLSYREISIVTGVPAGTVMSRLARARRRLAESLGALMSEAS